MNFFEFNNMGFHGGYGGENNKNNEFNQNNSFNNNAENDMGAFQNKFENYRDKSEDELMDELSRVVRKMKSDGTFDIGALENFYATATPFLNPTQRERMKSIIDMLKQQ